MNPLLAAALVDPWSLVRVDVPDHPDAVATSSRGSTLPAPPADGTPWRYESVAETDGDIDTAVPASDIAHEAMEAMAIGPWHEAGFTGQGVKVAIFDVQWSGELLRADTIGEVTTHDCRTQRSCDLPIDTLHPIASYELGGHGSACAEIVRAVAPDAELHLVQVVGQTTLENAVEWAVREQIDVISMSLSFYNDSFYDGSGPVSALVAELAAGDVLMVTSAGNGAEEHWLQTFQDSDRDGFHEFPWGGEYLPLDLDEGYNRVLVSWDEFGGCGTTDFDAAIYDAHGYLVARGTEPQDPDADHCEPVERLYTQSAEAGWHYLRLFRARGSQSPRFDVVNRTGTVWQAMAEGSTTDPGTHPLAFTIGAVTATETYAVDPPAWYSSQGPTNGGVPKPDVAGPSSLTTSASGPGGFAGTSASTPAVAGALAVMLSADPDASPYDVAERLKSHALGEGSTWSEPDPGLGAGRVRLPPPDAPPLGCGHCGAILLPLLGGLLRRRRFPPGLGADMVRAWMEDGCE